MMSLYGGLLLISTVCAAVLARLGAHLVVRRQVIPSLVLSQVALLGVSLGAALGSITEHWGIPHGLLEVGLGCLLCFLLDPFLRRSAPGELALGVYLFMMGLNALVFALLPGLESHRAQSFFGDPATALQSELGLVLIVSFVAMGVIAKYERFWIRDEMLEVLAGGLPPVRPRQAERAFRSLQILVFVISIFCFGFLWSLALLTIGPLFLRQSLSGVGRFFWICVGLSALANLLGIALSLGPWEWPSAAAVVVSLGFCASLTRVFLSRLRSN